MAAASAPALEWRWHEAGLDRLIDMLRRRGLPVGASEAIDAARLLRHQAETTQAQQQNRAALQPVLRPVLCKTLGDRALFDAVFDEWAALTLEGEPGLPPPVALPAPAAAGAHAAPRASRASRMWWILLAVAVLGIVFVWVEPMVRDFLRPKAPVVDQPGNNPPAMAASSAPVPTAAPGASAPGDMTIYGYFPTPRFNEEVRPLWWWLLLGLLWLGIAPWLWARASQPMIGRRRGVGSVRLPAWPASKHLRQLVFKLPPGVEGALARHVQGRAEERQTYARRPLLDPQRTVQATLARLGWPTLRHRYARLRPSYLVLVRTRRGEVQGEAQDEDLGVLWALRLRELDVQVEVFRFDPAQVQAVEVGGAGRRLPLAALPQPQPGQRLIVIGELGDVLHANGSLQAWAQAAQLHRWPQRALFTPEEPRDWNPARVDALERSQGADTGMLVLPFEDNALQAWSDWLVRGHPAHHLPEVMLAEPQFYPRLLQHHAARFVGDAPDSDLGQNPAQVGAVVSQLITQLQTYLGENGFYWLCTCAVPPLLQRRLALLLGEQYFLRCGASEERTRYHMARNWRLLVRLPWLRDELPMPQWLRLALLTRLPEAIQDELREVVRGALGASAERAGVGALTLGFDPGLDPGADPSTGAPQAAEPPAPVAHALFVGFVHDELHARQLALRIPGSWQRWLPTLLPRTAWWRRLPQWWARLWLRQGVAGQGTSAWARVWAVGTVGLALAGVLAVSLLPPARWSVGPRGWVFERVVHGKDGIVRLAGGGNARSSAFSPDGQRLVVGYWDGQLRLWDTQTGQPIGAPLEGHEGVVNSVAFSSDGRRIVSGSSDSTLLLWDVPSGRAIHSPLKGHENSVYSVAFSADGLRVVSGSDDKTLRLWDAQTGQPIGSPLKGHEYAVWSVAFSPGGQRIVSGSADYTLRLWDAQTGQPIGAPLKGHDGIVYSVDFSPDGRRIVSGSSDHTLRLWDAQTGHSIASPLTGHESDVYRVAFSPDGRRIASGSRSLTVRLWDAQTGQSVGVALEDHVGDVTSVAFSPDGYSLLSTDGSTLLRIQATPPPPLLTLPQGQQQARFSPDGYRVLTVHDRVAQIWDARSGEPLTAPLTHPAQLVSARFSADGQRLLTRSEDGSVHIWQAGNGSLVAQIPDRASAPPPAAASTQGAYTTALLTGLAGSTTTPASSVRISAISRDGSRIVTAEAGAPLRLWDGRSGAALPVAGQLNFDPIKLAFDATGTRLLAAGLRKFAFVGAVLNLDTGVVVPLAPVTPAVVPVTTDVMQFSPDGRRVLLGGSAGPVLWDAQTGAVIGRLGDDKLVMDAQFSADGKRVITAGLYGTAQVWDAAAARAIGPPLRHQGVVSRAVFSPDGERVATIGRDEGTVRVWQARTGDLLGVPVQVRGDVVDLDWGPTGTSLVVATQAPQAAAPAPAPSTGTGMTTRTTEAARPQRWAAGPAYVVYAPPAEPGLADPPRGMAWALAQVQALSQMHEQGSHAGVAAQVSLALVLLALLVLAAHRQRQRLQRLRGEAAR